MHCLSCHLQYNGAVLLCGEYLVKRAKFHTFLLESYEKNIKNINKVCKINPSNYSFYMFISNIFAKFDRHVSIICELVRI